MIVRFQYQATDEQGRSHSGQIEASDRLKATDQLLDRGWTIVTLEPAVAAKQADDASLSERDVLTMLEQLQTLTRSGLPLPDGLRAASAELESKPLRATFADLANRLETGLGLDAILLAEANRFPAHLQGLIQAGDRTGRLAEVLGQVVHGGNLGQELRRKIWASLAYPATVLAVILILTLFICRISSQVNDGLMLEQQIFSMRPPLIIASVFALTRFIAENDVGLVLGGGGFALVFWLIWSRLVPPVFRRRRWHALPLIGPMVRDVALAEFCQLSALLVEAATPLPEAIRLAGASVRDPALAEDCSRVAAAVAMGEPLSTALQLWGGVPAGLGQLLAWGEGHQDLAGALRFAGDMFEERAEAQATFARQVLSSSLLLLIIWWLGFAIASIYLPITYSIQLLSKMT